LKWALKLASFGESAFNECDLRIENDKNDLQNFRVWLQDQNKSKVTQETYLGILKRAFRRIGKPLTLKKIKNYLRKIRETHSPDHFSLNLSAFKNYLRFKGYDGFLDDFKFVHKGFVPKRIPTREELQAFFNALPTLGSKAFFIILATSGLRPGEVKSLTLEDVDFKQRMLRPSCHSGVTKRSWISFYNQEAQNIIEEFRANLSKRQRKSKKRLPISSRDLKRDWRIAKETTGLNLKPKDLRDWFCA